MTCQANGLLLVFSLGGSFTTCITVQLGSGGGLDLPTHVILSTNATELSAL